MKTGEKIKIFNDKINEYYLSCFPGPTRAHLKPNIHNFPVCKFNIQNIFTKITNKYDENDDVVRLIADKLIDIKLSFTYLQTTSELFYKGPTLIVGNNELEKLNPNTISILRENHYKVFLISTVFESFLDLMQLVINNKITDHKKNKWRKILELIPEKFDDLLTDKEMKLLCDFKSEYRTAEFHKFSKLRSFTAKDKWNHFQDESNSIKDILLRLDEIKY